MTHTVLTFITKVQPDQVGPLTKLLDQIGLDPEQNTYVPFRSLKLLHFASFVLHQSPETPEYGPYLVFENNFDGELNGYLEDLCAHASAGLHQIYSCCLDYTIKSASDSQGIINYLSAHVVRPNAYHIGNTGRSAARIQQEQALRDALEAHADTLVEGGQPSSLDALLTSFQQFVRADPQWSWMPGPPASVHGAICCLVQADSGRSARAGLIAYLAASGNHLAAGAALQRKYRFGPS